MCRGMGEKQIEVDKRLLRAQISSLKRSLEDVRRHRSSYRRRRSEVLYTPLQAVWACLFQIDDAGQVPSGNMLAPANCTGSVLLVIVQNEC